MSESTAITGVVTSLKTLRDDYQLQLENVPQYAAFKQIEQAASRVADALGIAVGSDGISPAHDVLSALALAQVKFRDHLGTVPEYRALLAIDKLIADLDTLVQPPVEAPVATDSASVTETAPAPIEETAHDITASTGVLGGHASYESAVEGALSEETAVSDHSPTAEPISAVEAATIAAETPTVETTIGEVAFAPQPETAQTEEHDAVAALETPTDVANSERAA